jgi:hypothetical protein
LGDVLRFGGVPEHAERNLKNHAFILPHELLEAVTFGLL